MKKARAKSLAMGTVLVAVLGTTAAECRATESSPYPMGSDGTVIKRERVTAPINVKDYFLTTDAGGFPRRFETNKADYDACMKGEEYPTCTGR